MTHDHEIVGPVPISQLATHGARVLSRAEDGEWVPISRNGIVIGWIGPTTPNDAIRLGLITDDGSSQVSSRTLTRDNASAVVERVASGESVLVTHHNKPRAVFLTVDDARAEREESDLEILQSSGSNAPLTEEERKSGTQRKPLETATRTARSPRQDNA